MEVAIVGHGNKKSMSRLCTHCRRLLERGRQREDTQRRHVEDGREREKEREREREREHRVGGCVDLTQGAALDCAL